MTLTRMKKILRTGTQSNNAAMVRYPLTTGPSVFMARSRRKKARRGRGPGHKEQAKVIECGKSSIHPKLNPDGEQRAAWHEEEHEGGTNFEGELADGQHQAANNAGAQAFPETRVKHRGLIEGFTAAQFVDAFGVDAQ